MLTLKGLMAVISLCLMAFGLEYSIGSKDNNKPQNSRPVLRKQAAILLIFFNGLTIYR